LELDITSADIKANCDDLKVLGKGDFKSLLKWRSALREEVCYAQLLAFSVDPFVVQVGLDVKTTAAEELTEAVEVTEELDEEEQIQNEVCFA
jgi:AdoMet-dependent rRNA methyltransferase SPB1